MADTEYEDWANVWAKIGKKGEPAAPAAPRPDLHPDGLPKCSPYSHFGDPSEDSPNAASVGDERGEGKDMPHQPSPVVSGAAPAAPEPIMCVGCDHLVHLAGQCPHCACIASSGRRQPAPPAPAAPTYANDANVSALFVSKYKTWREAARKLVEDKS